MRQGRCRSGKAETLLQNNLETCNGHPSVRQEKHAMPARGQKERIVFIEGHECEKICNAVEHLQKCYKVKLIKQNYKSTPGATVGEIPSCTDTQSCLVKVFCQLM